MQKCLVAVLAIVSGVLSPHTMYARGQNPSRVETTLIGSFPGAQLTFPVAINNHGVIAGNAQNLNFTGRDAAFLWTPDDGFQVIGDDTVLTDLNDRGDATGYRCRWVTGDDGSTSCVPRGFIWNQRTGLVDIDVDGMIPNAINNRGDVAGTCGNLQACALRGGVLNAWPCELEDCSTEATAINDRGDVVVNRGAMNFIGEVTVYPLRGTPILFAEGSGGADINNARIIAGSFYELTPARSRITAALWTRSGGVRPPSEPEGLFVALNARALSVGFLFGTNEDFRSHAIAWDAKRDELLELAQTVESQAVDVNDRGQIVGYMQGDQPFWSTQIAIWTVRR